MKVGLLISRGANTRYRFPQLAPYLAREGIEVETHRLGGAQTGFFRMLSRLREMDAVVILRKLLPGWKLRLVRRNCRRLIFEYDDALMYRSSRWAQQYSATRRKRFNDVVRACDLLLAGNGFLVEEARRLGGGEKVRFMPTVVDIERYTAKRYDVVDGKVRLGWLGSKGTLFYLKKLAPVLEVLGKRFPFVELQIVCNDFFDLQGMPVLKKQWAEEDEVRDLQGFDIGLGPLTDDVWTRGKCGLKLVQYLAVGVPAVCSPVGANKEIVTDGEIGFWAANEDEWIEKLSILINDGKTRRDMGYRGRERIVARYSVQAMIPRLVQYLRDLAV
jgi:hypothetical protein